MEEKSVSRSYLAMCALRELILSGELPAGTDHLESELAARLGVSRTPIREAALMLEAQALLEVRPRKGVRILTVSVDDMHEIYEVLTELESTAARRAAEAQHDPATLAELVSWIVEMERALEQNDREAWAVADDAFHAELVRLGGNRRIIAIIANFNDQVGRVRAMTLRLRPMPHQSNEDHRALVDAIFRGDGGEAHRLHWNHRAATRQLLTGLLESHGVKHV